MAVIIASGSGNWSSPATWRGGVKPSPGDDVYANGFTINIDENIDVASLNNSAVSRPISTPIMTSNNTPSGVAAASNITASANDAWRVFDRVVNSWATSGSIRTGWVSYDFGAGNEKIINAYSLTGTATQNINPQSWSFQGSNDSTTWDTLDSGIAAGGIGVSAVVSNLTLANTTSYRYYRVTGSTSGVGVNLGITEVTMYESSSIWGSLTSTTAGGTFNFNTAAVTASITGLGAAAGNLLSITHTTGTVSITVSNNLNTVTGTTIISYSGNGDLIFTCPNINTTAPSANTNGISKTGSGTLTLSANCNLTVTAGQNSNYVVNSTNGNIILNGNLTLITTFINTAATIRQTVGNLTINGNIILPAFYATAVQTINFTGTLLTINGNIISNVGNGISSTGAIVVNGNVNGAYNANTQAIITSANVTINGNLYAANNIAVYSTSAITVNVTGDVYASYIASGIYLTNGSSVVNLTGNMYNVNGVQAIFAPTILVSPSATTQWTLQQLGVKDKVFYSSDTTPGNPITANVRNGITYGAGLGTTGTMIVPSASDVRMGVAVDNTTGTGELTAADFLTAIQVSADPIAERLRNISTVDSTGNIIKNYNT